MRKILIILCFVVFVLEQCTTDHKVSSGYKIKPVPIRNVEITDQFWLPKIKTIQQTTIKFALNKCENEGRMENFLIAGGVKEGKALGKMPFDDTDLYKIIEGASYSLISNPDTELEQYLDSLISIIKIGQEKDGYLTTWFTIDSLNPPAEWVKADPRRWHSIGGHELYNSGHLFEAAAAHYRATGKRDFLNIALKNADLLVRNFGKDTLRIPPGHQIVETGLIKLYQLTGNTAYLKLSKFYLDQRGDSLSHDLGGEYNQDHLPVTQQTEAVGHAVRAVYMYAGMTDIAAIYNDSSYLNAVKVIWQNMVCKKMYLTGGIGSRHDGEAFGENYELPNCTAYNETCAAIGDVYWNHRLFLLTGDPKYYSIIERTLYNGLIAGISLDGEKFFYPNPLESDGEYMFNHGSATRQEWFDCSCCPTNLIRFIPTIPELIYATSGNSLYVNLFTQSKAEVLLKDQAVTIEQVTNYPWSGEVLVKVDPEDIDNFDLLIRIPGWLSQTPLPSDLYRYADNGFKKFAVFVNGEEVNGQWDNGYISLKRVWKKGDEVKCNFNMEVRKVYANYNVADDRGLVAFEYGPLVYCAEQIDNQCVNLDAISIPENAIPQKGKILFDLDKVSTLNVNTVNNDTLTLIPYYVWANRGVDKMKVWFNE